MFIAEIYMTQNVCVLSVIKFTNIYILIICKL